MRRLISSVTAFSTLNRTKTLRSDETFDIKCDCFFYTKSYKSDIRRVNQTKKVWDIKKNVLGPELCNMLPFIHAYTGCDAISMIYGISKEAVLKLFRTSPKFRQIIEILNEEEPDVNKITTHGKEAILFLNNGDTLEELDILRFRKFTQKVCTTYQAKRLPCAFNHCAHTYRHRYGEGTTHWMQ
ncbi:hypothetical protein DPMN_194846 [Dreissena polymorpha]|uniref:Uncharacterized protein n=1 Tax=Dreissena polymorpha TaxID=45954 RepID=A0A9D3Y5S2_DREPO|nr:hypothetical protein DPMN_194846 [Dreissena polymorpha]